VETNIHYPTDSTLLGDGVRVLTRVMKKISAVAGAAGTRFRDRSRAVKLRVLAIARASRNKTESGKQRLKQSYVKLLDATSRVVGQAKKFSREIAERVKRGSRAMLRRAKKQLDEMVPRVQQVIRQTKARVLGGNTHAEGKLLSVFETHTEVIRKGKTDKPNEFGKLIKIQEAENQIITDYEVYDQRPADSTLLIPSLEQHVKQFERVPELVAADPGFFSAANEAQAEEKGVKRVSDSQPRHQERGAPATAKATLVQEGSEMAHRMRGAHQCSQTQAWVGAVTLPRAGWHEEVGWTRSYRRQHHSHRHSLGRASIRLIHRPISNLLTPTKPTVPLIDSSQFSLLPAAFLSTHSIAGSRHLRQPGPAFNPKSNFAPESSYAFSRTTPRKSGPCGAALSLAVAVTAG